MLIKFLALFLAVTVTHGLPADVALPRANHPDVGLSIVQMIQRQDYPVETHSNVETSDGYLLDIHRIPYGKNNSDIEKKPVVFLMHGLLCSAIDWVTMGPDKALAYLLADAGYDVWMGNARGTTWSKKHKKYNPKQDREFWNFSWHEIGTRDLPAMIDYVLNVTGDKKLFYVGHSQGTTAFFVMTSEKPEYNEKIRLMSALAPVAYMSNLPGLIPRGVLKFLLRLESLITDFGMQEFPPFKETITRIGQKACKDESILQSLCSSILFLICGWGSKQLNTTMLPVILSNTPAGASTKQLVHYGQEMKSGYFRQYDYGSSERNLHHHGSSVPPDYNIKNIQAPVALYYSENDWLSAVVDVEQLVRELPNLKFQYLVPDSKFNHLDFIFGIGTKKLVYDPLMTLMKCY